MADNAQSLAVSLGAVPVDNTAPVDGAATPAGELPQVKSGANAPNESLAVSMGAVPVDTDLGRPANAAAPEGATAPTEAPETDVLGSVKRGLKTTLAPFLLDEKDIKGQHTLADTGIEVGTSIASDVLTTAAVSAVAGLLTGGAGAVLAPILLGLYRGVGYEAARSGVEHEAFNPLRALLNSAAEITPNVTKGTRLAKAAVQGTLEAGKQLAYGENAESAGVAGLVGGAVAGLFHHQGPGWFAVVGDTGVKPTSLTKQAAATKGELSGYAEMIADKSPTGWSARVEQLATEAHAADPEFFQLGDKLEKAESALAAREAHASTGAVSEVGFDGMPVEGVKPKLEEAEGTGALISDMNKFKRFVAETGAGLRPGQNKSEVEAAFDHYQNVRGPEQLEKDYQVFKLQQIADKASEERATKIATDMAPAMKDPVGRGWVDKLTDIKFVMRKLDDNLGTNFDGMVDRFTQAKNKQSTVMASYLEQANNLTMRARKIGLSNEEIGKWLAQDEEKKVIELTGEKLEVANAWKDLWEDARQKLNREGLKVDRASVGGVELERYLPKKSVDGADLKTAIRRMSTDLEKKYGPNYLGHMNDDGQWVANEASEDLRRVIAHFKSKPGNSLDPSDIRYRNDIREVMDDALDPQKLKSMIGFDSNASYQRDKAALIPEFVRDYDVGNLFVGYLNNNFKALFYHDAFVDLKANIASLRKLGYTNSADYLERYAQDISGMPGQKLATVQHAINRYQAYMDEVIDNSEGLKNAAAKVARQAPNFMSWVTGAIYPNYLGGNIRAAVRNYMQPILMTAPELGGGYGAKVVTRASFESAHDMLTKGGLGHLEQELQKRGLAPGKFFGEAHDVTSGSLRNMPYVGAAIETVDKMNSGGFKVLGKETPGLMSLYSLSDNINRFVTLKVGQQVARDIEKGNPQALAFLNKASAGLKNELRKAGEDPEQMGEIIGRYLIGKTQFNYGKESLNEFGREYGRLFSMFTKWPAMIMSDMHEMVRKDGGLPGVGRVTMKYFAPAAMLSVVGSQLLDIKDNPALTYLLGSDLSGAAPVGSLAVNSPPLLQTASDAAKALQEVYNSDTLAQKAGKVGKFVGKTALTFVPGMGLVNEYSRARRAFKLGDQ